MPLGNLSVKVGADISGYTSNMDIAAAVAKDRMGSSADSVDGFRASLLQASADMQRFALSIDTNMTAANDAAKSGSEKIANAIGVGIGAGFAATNAAWDTFESYVKTKMVITGLAIVTGVTAVVLTGVYAAYKAADFAIGLFTGDSYKSASIDALIEINNKVKDLQDTLHVTAQEASATNAALVTLGVSNTDFSAVFTGAAAAVRANTDELDRLGVKYKDAAGNVLPLATVVANANAALNAYTEGWDRNQAATAIGLGTAAQVAAAAKVTESAIAEAGSRLNDYNLGIGEESQASVARYEAEMQAFNRETELTSAGFKRAWADQIMPILTDLAEYLKDGFPYAVNAFRYSMATITSLFYGLKTVAYIVSESILGSISAIGSVLGAVATASARLLSGDFTGAKEALVSGWSDAKNRLGDIGDGIVIQARHNADAMRQAWAMDDRADSPAAKVKKGKQWVAKPDDDDDEVAAKADPFDAAMNNLGSQKAGIDFVIANFDKFQGKVKESKEAMADFDVTMGRFSDAQRKKEEFSPLTEAQKSAYIAGNKYLQDQIELERQMQILRKFDNAGDQFAFKERQQIESRKQDVEWMGKSAQELAKLTEARRISGEIDSMINATEIELGKKGLKITQDKIDSIRALGAEMARQSGSVIDQSYVKARDPWFNATESIRKYGEEATNTGVQIGNAIGNSFKTAEDAFVKFATTGKLEFKSMAASILSDLARIAAKKAIAGLVDMAIGAYSGGSSSASVGDGGWLARGDLAGARAAGGPVGGGLSYLVGEKGPEIFTPSAGGTIIPNHELGGSGGAVTINLSTTVSNGASNTDASGDSNSQSRSVADALNAKFKQMIVRETQQGGIIYNFQNGRG